MVSGAGARVLDCADIRADRRDGQVARSRAFASPLKRMHGVRISTRSNRRTTLAGADPAAVQLGCATTGTCSHGRKADCKTSKYEEMTMAWTTPTLVEICIGLEINGYLPAEF